MYWKVKPHLSVFKGSKTTTPSTNTTQTTTTVSPNSHEQGQFSLDVYTNTSLKSLRLWCLPFVTFDFLSFPFLTFTLLGLAGTYWALMNPSKKSGKLHTRSTPRPNNNVQIILVLVLVSISPVTSLWHER